MQRIAPFAVAFLLGCAGGGGGLVLPLEHRAVAREEPLAAGISRLVWAVTLDDERGEDENYLCTADRDILSERPISHVVREAVESELRVRDLRVATPDEADVVIHIALHDVGCTTGMKSGAFGLRAKIEAEVGLRVMPGQREVYWTTLTQTSFRVPPGDRNTKREVIFRRAFEEVIDGFAQHVATHPDVMIKIQELQSKGELPQ
jgi:hypothetical protein